MRTKCQGPANIGTSKPTLTPDQIIMLPLFILVITLNEMTAHLMCHYFAVFMSETKQPSVNQSINQSINQERVS